MKAYTAARWLSGVPLWNPLSGCGEPWLAQLQTGVFYPGDLPFFLPGAWGPLLGIALHLAIASSGMAAWLSGLGTSRAGALLGAWRVRGRRRFSLARARLQQLRDRVVPAVAVPGGTARGARRLAGGACRRLRSRVSGRRAGSGCRRRRVRGPRRVRDARRRPRVPSAGRSGRLAPCGRTRPRRRPRGGRRDSFLRIRRVLRPAHGRDERRGARAAGRNVGSHRPRPSAVRRAPHPPVRRPRGIPHDARALSARSPARGRRGRGPRGASPPPRRAVAPLSPWPPPRARGARRAASRALGRGTREGRAVSRALVRLHAARPRGPLGRRPRRLAARAASGLAEGPCARGRRGRVAIRRPTPRARCPLRRGSRGAPRCRSGRRPSDRSPRVDGACGGRGRRGASRVRARRRAARSSPRGRPARRDRGTASSSRVGERVRVGAARASAFRRGGPGRRPGPGVSGVSRTLLYSRRSPAKPAESGAARRARGRTRPSRATRTCRSASPRRPRRRRSGIRGARASSAQPSREETRRRSSLSWTCGTSCLRFRRRSPAPGSNGATRASSSTLFPGR